MTALADRVKESTTTTGTGSLTLSGAVTQFESFNTAFGTANPFYYVITDANGTDWEVGTGELSNATTLVRTTVHQSSNGDAKINLSAGTHTVFCSAPAVFLSDRASKTGKLSQFAATTSAELAGVISDETGTGALVFATSPALTTPSLGVATATSVNGTTIPSSKTLVVTTDKLSALAATTSAELAGVISDETGSGALVFATSPSLTTPNIGAATATSVNGTTIPSSKTLVVTTDKLSALAATTSSELAGVISDETGSGALVFATSPTLTTPNIGAATATSVNGTTIPSSKTLVVTTDKLSALAATTSAELAGVISDETGTGSLVFATSPALTTPNLGTPSAGTLTNCTGLPVGGVSGFGTGVSTALAVNTGTAGAFVVDGGALGTPSSGTVTNLTGTASININGTVGATSANTGAFTTISASGVATFSAGTVSAPAITTTGDTNTGEYFPAADTIGWTTGGTERMRVDSSGNVGIGTSSPDANAKLDVSGTIRTGSGGTDPGTGAALYFVGSGSFQTVVAGAAFAVNTGNNNARTERMRIDGSGNVGIGTSSPGSKLVVEGNVATGLATGSQLLIRRTTNTTHVAGLCFANGLSRGPILGTLANSDDLVLGETDGATFYERMRIKSAENNVLIGCTANPSSSVVGVRLGQAGSQGFGASAAGGTGTLEHWYYYNTNGQVGSITTNGSATAYNTSSDRRLKENITPAEKAIEVVNAIEIVKHDWRAGGHTRFGVVAQDLNKVYPEAVAVGDDGENVEKTWGVDYSKLVPVLTKAIQEQQAQIEALKAEVAALKG